MTKEDIIAHLKAELKEELEGILKYGEMHKHACENGMLTEADMLEDIARDEYTHACAIKSMLEKNGVDLSHHTEYQALWHKVDEAFDD